MALIRAESENPELAKHFCPVQSPERVLGMQTDINIMGPVPAPISRMANRHRFQLMLIATHRSTPITAPKS